MSNSRLIAQPLQLGASAAGLCGQAVTHCHHRKRNPGNATYRRGGTDRSRVTHQFFYGRRALYLVVWNARKGHEQDEVQDWLRRIRHGVGADARVIIVATHCEDRIPDLDFRQLDHDFLGMLAGHFEGITAPGRPSRTAGRDSG